ncbi:hypothetical protein ACJRO7_007271 [Eucalyptus globulus]|uniref:Uncharacterized protein n=1 Tax=Eucalyptus globulus TaxID=34317 RepID=A0ABD3IKP5_EUCGL
MKGKLAVTSVPASLSRKQMPNRPLFGLDFSCSSFGLVRFAWKRDSFTCRSVTLSLPLHLSSFFPLWNSMATTVAIASELPLKDRVAIVTGSSRGIGRAIPLHLASLGAKVVVNYTSPGSSAQSDAIVAAINSSSHGSTVSVRADVSDPD